MSRYCLDTNILSSLIRLGRDSPVLARISEVGEMQICTSVVVAAEIRYGVAKKGSPRLAREAEAVLGALTILPLEEPVARYYGAIRTDLERRGTPIGPNDLLIAAQCLAGDLTLVTNNGHEFRRVQDLRVEDWLA